VLARLWRKLARSPKSVTINESHCTSLVMCPEQMLREQLLRDRLIIEAATPLHSGRPGAIMMPRVIDFAIQPPREHEGPVSNAQGVFADGTIQLERLKDAAHELSDDTMTHVIIRQDDLLIHQVTRLAA